MNRKIARSLAVFSAAIALSTATAAVGDDFKPYSYGDVRMNQDQAVMVIQEPGNESATHSGLAVQPPSTGSTDTRGMWQWCGGTKDPVCDMKNSSLDLIAWPIIPTCAEAKGEICVESLEVAAPAGDYQKATFLRSAKDGIRIEGDKGLGLIEGVTPSLFDAPNAPNRSGATTYAVRVQLEQHFDHRTGEYYAQSLQANVIPYVSTPGDFTPSSYDSKAKPGEEYNNGRGDLSCQWLEVGTCGKRTDFVEGTKVKLTFRIPENLGGWFSGRMKTPNISVKKFSESANVLSVEGAAVDVPQLAYVKAKSEIQVEKTLNVGRGGSGQGEFWGVTAGGPGSEDVFTWVDLYRKQLNETAAGVATYWRMMTVSGRGGACLADTSEVLGIVTTNAMGFDIGAPKFQSGSLNYQVTGLHYMPDGKTEVEGTYDLVMRSETARCLYGFSKAPISAKVSVTSATGEAKVATTVVRETKDGWLQMAAYGFTFSSPTISVKMTQAKATSAKTTITCLKGKITKKVTAVNATCPTGYKKKP